MNCIRQQAKRLPIAALLAVFILAAGTAVPAQGQAVQIANVNLSFSTTKYSPAAVNDNQWIVGNYTTSSGAILGFLNVPGSATQTLEDPYSNGTFTRANGVNNSNTTVGDYRGTDQEYHGFIYPTGLFGGFSTYNLPGFKSDNEFSTSLYGVSNVYIENGTQQYNLAGASTKHGTVEGFVVIGGNTPDEFWAGGDDSTYAYAVNTAGEAVGQYLDPQGHSYCFTWTEDSGVKTIVVPGASWAACNGINDYGVITGKYLDYASVAHGFTYSTANDPPVTTTDLIVDGISDSNSLGYMVGSYVAPGGATEGFLQSPPPKQQEAAPVPLIPAQGARSTSVYGIDVAGDVVGTYTDSDTVSHGMLLTHQKDGPPTLTPIDNPDGGQSTVCQAIKAPDDIVCNYFDANDKSHAAVYDSTATPPTWTEIHLPDSVSATFFAVYGINTSGDLAGTFIDGSNAQHGFLLTAKGQFSQLDVDVKGATFTFATGVNTNDEVVAQWGDALGYVHSSSYLNGTWVDENLPGASNCYIGGIDDHGDLSYTWTGSGGDIHGGYYNAASGNYYLFDVPGNTVTGTRVYGIVFQPGTGKPLMVGRYLPTATSTNFNSYEFVADAYGQTGGQPKVISRSAGGERTP
jgi:hypothetical protein